MSIEFAGKQLPDEAATDHFCFIGSTGSGKTVLIRRLIQSVFPNKIGSGDRAIVYDVKNDMLPILHAAVGKDGLVKTLNPFDARCFAWDMAQDITEPAHAIEFASILIPPEKNSSQPFFSDAARHLLAGVITAFIYIDRKLERRWTFRDVMFVMFNQELLRTVLLATTETKAIAELYFGNEKTTKDIMSTVATKLASFRLISALWDYRLQQDESAKISLTEWLKKGFVLVLGNSHTNQASVDAINRVIFKRASQLILDQPEPPRGSKKINRTWMILDEFVRIGKLDGIVQLTTEGRSKGACVVLGFQDINGVRAVYEKEVAEEIIGQCSNLAILKIQSPETAQWTSDFIGLVREIITTGGKTITLGADDTSRGKSENEQEQDRPKVLPSEFRLLPKPSKSNPKVVGYFASDRPPFNQKVIRYEITGLFSGEGLWEDDSVEGFQPYPDGKTAQRLRIWKTDEDERKDDYRRLKLSKLSKKVEHEERKRKQKDRDDELQEVIQRINWRGYLTESDEEFRAQLSEKEKETFSRQLETKSRQQGEGRYSNLPKKLPTERELESAIQNAKVDNEDDQ